LSDKLYESAMKWYSLRYPSHWKVEVIESIPAFFDLNGTGALQVSSFKNKKGSYSLSEEMKRYLLNHKVEYDKSKIVEYVKDDGCEIQACEFTAGNRFWMVYMIHFKNLLLLCTFNSDNKPATEEALTISKILQSITIQEEYL